MNMLIVETLRIYGFILPFDNCTKTFYFELTRLSVIIWSKSPSHVFVEYGSE